MSYTKTDQLVPWGPGKIHPPVASTHDDPTTLSPSDGDRHIVGTGSDVWAGQDGKVATYNDTTLAWEFTTLNTGDMVFDVNQSLNLTYDGSSPTAASGGGSGADGISITGANISGDNLILTRSGGEPDINAGDVRGPAGPTGDAGANGSDGASGPSGIDGKTIWNGDRAPFDEGSGSPDGSDGDFWIRTDTSDIYGPRDSGAWGSATSLIGDSGSTGPAGAAGADGATILNGTDDPTSTDPGSEGDFYIKTDTNEIYGPKTVSGWGSPTSLVGPSGGGGTAITQLNTSVEVVDTGSDGEIIMKTEGSDRWKVTQGGHILPQSNDSYDIGSAEYKVRDLYVSDSSLWVGDQHKVQISDGKMKFRKRKVTAIPPVFVTWNTAIPGDDQYVDEAAILAGLIALLNAAPYNATPPYDGSTTWADISLDHLTIFANLPRSNVDGDADGGLGRTNQGPNDIFRVDQVGDWDEDFEAGAGGETGPQGPAGSDGSAGVAGDTGPAGAAGADGATILNGTDDPTSTDPGSEGDFYIKTDTNEIYGPKTVSGWGSPTSLVGPSGGGGTAITQLNTSVEVVDTGSDGEIIMKTEGSDRWKVTQGGHILPQSNDSYDIGSAEYKVRDLYVSDSSLWVGDNHKITIDTSGKMKFRKRKTNSVPAAVIAAGGNSGNALAHSGKGALSDMKLKHWKAYMQTLAGQGGAQINDIFRQDTEDYEEDISVGSELSFGIPVENYGEIGGGDDKAAFIAAFNSGDKIELVAGKTYNLAGWSEYSTVQSLRLNGNGATISVSEHFIRALHSVEITNCKFVGDDTLAKTVVRNLLSDTSSDSDLMLDFINNTCNYINPVYIERPFERVRIERNIIKNNKGVSIRLGTNNRSSQDLWKNMYIQDNIIDGVSAALGHTSDIGILVYGQQAHIKNNIIKNIDGLSVATECHGIYTKCRMAIISGNIIENIVSEATTTGITIKGVPRDLHTDFVADMLANSGIPVSVDGYSTLVLNNNIEDSGKMSALRVLCDDCLVANNVVNDPWIGLYLHTGGHNQSRVKFSNNIVRGTGRDGAFGAKFSLSGEFIDLVGNDFFDFGGSGGGGLSLTTGPALANPQEPVDAKFVTIRGNKFHNCYMGSNIGPRDVVNLSVIDNHIYGTSDYIFYFGVNSLAPQAVDYVYIAATIAGGGPVPSLSTDTGSGVPGVTAVANAGANQAVAIGALVSLDGSGSSDLGGGSLVYSWTLTSPEGSSASLSDPAVESPTFTPDVEGEYVLALSVRGAKTAKFRDVEFRGNRHHGTLGVAAVNWGAGNTPINYTIEQELSLQTTDHSDVFPFGTRMLINEVLYIETDIIAKSENSTNRACYKKRAVLYAEDNGGGGVSISIDLNEDIGTPFETDEALDHTIYSSGNQPIIRIKGLNEVMDWNVKFKATSIGSG